MAVFSEKIAITDNSYELMMPKKGDTVTEMLDEVGFDAKELLKNYNKKLKNTPLSIEQQQLYLHKLKIGLENYTYLKI